MAKYCVFFETHDSDNLSHQIECSMCPWEVTWFWFDDDKTWQANEHYAYERVRGHAKWHGKKARTLRNVET